MSPDGGLWYLPVKIPWNEQQDVEQILVLDTRTMGITKIITPVQPFRALALSSDGTRLYASVPDTNEIIVIDTDTQRTVRRIGVGAKPFILLAVKAP